MVDLRFLGEVPRQKVGGLEQLKFQSSLVVQITKVERFRYCRGV